MSIGTPCKPDIVQLLFDESGKTVDWLQFDHGFVFTRGMSGFGTNTWLCKQQYVYKSNMEEDIDYAAEYPDYTFGDRSTTVGQYYDHIVSDYVALGGEYMLETTAYGLLYDAASNQVTGVKARSNVDHTEYTINAKVVIMCTGGFAGNTDLEVEYLQNPEYPLAQPWKLWGMAQNKGPDDRVRHQPGHGHLQPGHAALHPLQDDRHLPHRVPGVLPRRPRGAHCRSRTSGRSTTSP